MTPFVIIVDFKLHPGKRDAFRRLIDVNARDSCKLEKGCQRFDVLEVLTDADRIVLYEIYDDRDAFQAHVASAHFAVFNRDSTALVADKRVIEYSLVCEGSQASLA